MHALDASLATYGETAERYAPPCLCRSLLATNRDDSLDRLGSVASTFKGRTPMGLRATFRRLSGNSRSFHPSGRAAVVAATVFLGAMGALSADTVARVSAPAGARPGSFSFHPERSVVYPKVAAVAFHPKASGRGWRLRPSVKDEKAVYVSDAGANVVDVFDKKGRLTGQ